MRGDFTITILERLAEMAAGSVELIEAILVAGYGASRGRIEYVKRQLEGQRVRDSAMQEARERTKRRYYNLLAWLTRDGLICKEKKNGRRYFLTHKGIERLRVLRARRALPEKNYESAKSGSVVIVAFDVPERERRKRAWLRSALHTLGFSLLQKSLWVGKVKIPKQFLDDLLRLQLTDAVEIFEISKQGSLQRILAPSPPPAVSTDKTTRFLSGTRE